jgi:hypothetical protein
LLDSIDNTQKISAAQGGDSMRLAINIASTGAAGNTAVRISQTERASATVPTPFTPACRR